MHWLNSIKKLFELDNVELEFDEEALREVARIAVERKTGARGLRGVLEDVMTNLCLKFHLMKISKR